MMQAQHERPNSQATCSYDCDTGSSVLVTVSNSKPPAANEQRDCKSNSNGSAAPNKILFLDGVRGLAALLVVADHAGLAGNTLAGAWGVDMFFVLSAFLLTKIMERKCQALLEQRADSRQWALALVDYCSRRFLRVYPLFALTAVALALMPDDSRNQFFLTHRQEPFNLFKVLVFERGYRYHVFWTLPLEIGYYFFIPLLAVLTLKLEREWWVPIVPLYIGIMYEGLFGFRTDHSAMRPHLPTFLSGSLAAIVYSKADATIRGHSFQFQAWHKLTMRLVEYILVGLLASVCFKGMYFHWFYANPVPDGPGGAPFISVLLTLVILLELLSPTEIGTLLETNLLRFWGKISYSMYLLHSFVIYSTSVRAQKSDSDRIACVIVLTTALATLSFHLVEYPSQLLARRISRELRQRATRPHSLTVNYAPIE